MTPCCSSCLPAVLHISILLLLTPGLHCWPRYPSPLHDPSCCFLCLPTAPCAAAPHCTVCSGALLHSPFRHPELQLPQPLQGAPYCTALPPGTGRGRQRGGTWSPQLLLQPEQCGEQLPGASTPCERHMWSVGQRLDSLALRVAVSVVCCPEQHLEAQEHPSSPWITGR